MTSDYTGTQQRATKLVFTTTLQHPYQRASVIIYANVGAATHGETVSEILGDGDAGAAYQRFALKQAPLTFTRADTETGKESTLEIWVNDVRWSEVPSLFDRKPNERIYHHPPGGRRRRDRALRGRTRRRATCLRGREISGPYIAKAPDFQAWCGPGN